MSIYYVDKDTLMHRIKPERETSRSLTLDERKKVAEKHAGKFLKWQRVDSVHFVAHPEDAPFPRYIIWSNELALRELSDQHVSVVDKREWRRF